VGDDLAVRVFLPEGLDLLHVEARMDRTVPLPQEQLRLACLLGGQTAPRFVRIPHRHAIEGNAELPSGVPTEMLVGEHHELLAPLPRPRHDGGRIGRRADHAAVGADEGLNLGRRIDVGDGDDGRDVDTHLGELAPRNLELIARRHVGHGAARREIRQDHFLLRPAQDVGALRHEMHAAEDDEVGGVSRCCRARELQRVADEIGELDDFVALIVMPEDDEAIAERALRGGDARVHLVFRQAEILLGQRLALADAFFLNLIQKLYVHLLPRGFAPRTPL
jgi:hypothetical protein